MMDNRPPAEVFPLGEFLADELHERDMDRFTLARLMSGDWEVNLFALSLLIDSPTKGMILGEETAQDFARVFGTSPEYWMNLDRMWQAASPGTSGQGE